MRTMTAEQLGVIIRLLVDQGMPVRQAQALIDSGLLADLCKANFDEMNRNEFRKQCGLHPFSSVGCPPPLLLPLDGTIIIPADPQPFFPRESFVVGVGQDAGLPISFLCDDFQRLLVACEGSSSETRIRIYCLRRAENCGPIIKALGGQESVAVSLREIYTFLITADRERRHIFYTDGWAISARWVNDGWGLCAQPVRHTSPVFAHHANSLVVVRV